MAVNERGKLMRATIAAATVRVLAAHGISRLSFRRVAKEAGESLALINYHCPTTGDLLENASDALLSNYIFGFENAARSLAEVSGVGLRDFALRSLQIALSRERTFACAWSEVMLDARRHSQSLHMAARWNDELPRLWKLIARSVGRQDYEDSAIGAMDVVIGMIFIGLGTGVHIDDLASVLLDRSSPLDLLPQAHTAPTLRASSRKSQQTCRMIVDVAVEILIEEGPGALSFRALSSRSGMTRSGPAYHFGTIDAILACAQAELIEQSKRRYREVMQAVDRSGMDLAELSELTSTIFIVEATRHSRENFAFFGNWIEASRHQALQPVISSFVRDQYVAWQGVLEMAAGRPLPSSAGIIGLALFIGKLVRVLSTDADVTLLNSARKELFAGIEKLVHDAFW